MAGVLQVAGGILAYAAAASAIHQILGAVMFGMAVMCVGLPLAVGALVDIKASSQSQVAIFDKLGKPKA